MKFVAKSGAAADMSSRFSTSRWYLESLYEISCRPTSLHNPIPDVWNSRYSGPDYPDSPCTTARRVLIFSLNSRD